MKTAVAESSLVAYDGLKFQELCSIQRKVMSAIAELYIRGDSDGGYVSRKQIARFTGLESSTVAGRVNELVAAGRLVEQEQLAPCPVTGRRVHMVALANLEAAA